MASSYNVQVGKKRRRKRTKKRKSKRKTRKRKKKKRVCCAGPGCPEWMHCIHVLGDSERGIKPKSKKTLKKKKKGFRGKSSHKKRGRGKSSSKKGGSRKQTIIEGHHMLL